MNGGGIGGIAITKRRVFRIDSGQIHGSGKALFLSPRTKRKKFKSSGEKETRTIIIKSMDISCTIH